MVCSKRVSAVVSAMLLFLVHLDAEVPEKPVRVLVLHSYHHGFTWTDQVQSGIESEIDGSGREVEIGVEYLDAKRHPRRWPSCWLRKAGNRR
jgi:hypothetical protein